MREAEQRGKEEARTAWEAHMAAQERAAKAEERAAAPPEEPAKEPKEEPDAKPEPKLEPKPEPTNPPGPSPCTMPRRRPRRSRPSRSESARRRRGNTPFQNKTAIEVPIFTPPRKKAAKSKERPDDRPGGPPASGDRLTKRRAGATADAAFREWAEQRGRTSQGMNLADIVAS